jgi:hypothetical protein
MPQWTLEHRVFVYDSFLKSCESIIETQRLFLCRFTRPLNVRFFSVGLPQVTFIRRKATKIRRTEGRHSQANGDDYPRTVGERVEANFRERLQIFILQNGYHLSYILFGT